MARSASDLGTAGVGPTSLGLLEHPHLFCVKHMLMVAIFELDLLSYRLRPHSRELLRGGI